VGGQMMNKICDRMEVEQCCVITAAPVLIRREPRGRRIPNPFRLHLPGEGDVEPAQLTPPPSLPFIKRERRFSSADRFDGDHQEGAPTGEDLTEVREEEDVAIVESNPMEVYVRRERKTVLSYSTSPKRSFLNQPFRPRRFRRSPGYFAKYTMLSKVMPRNSMMTIWP